MPKIRNHSFHIRQPDELPRTGLITVAEAAQYLAMSACKIYEMSNLGTIPSVKIGKSRRFRLADLEQFVASL